MWVRLRSGSRPATRLALRAALVLVGGFAKMTRPGESGFEAELAQVGERASGIARARGSGVIVGARAPWMRDSARYRDRAAGCSGIPAPRACPDADVIFVAHAGLDKHHQPRRCTGKLPIDQVIRAKWWRVPFDQVPRLTDREA